MAAYDLVIFDFDGTLADTIPWFAGILNEVSDRYGFQRVDESEYDLLRSYNAVQIAKHLSLPPLKIPAIATYLRRRMTHEIDQINLVEGVDSVLRELVAAGVSVAVVSSNAEVNVRHVLGEELAPLMATYECGVSLFGKPPKLRHVLRLTQTDPERAIYLGDEIRDVEAAHTAGIASGAVIWGYNSEASLAEQGPTYVFRTAHEITPAILGGN